MHLIRHQNIKNVFKYLNERTQITFNEYNFIIYNEKDSHNIK